MIGTRLSHYDITAELGQGGMGHVYRARDISLGRDVAVKLLPDDYVGDAEWVARFEREARTLATLQHPNIASIYGFEESGGRRFLVMELVEGEDLSRRLERGPLPADEAVALAAQIARGLEAAHEQGLVHRDLKPANVRITADQQAKILDFGLAKALLPEASSGGSSLSMSPTLTVAGTRADVILGTASYMSPEQARGRPVDRRTDIWAFGCVLYEMLTGRKVFGGDNLTDILAGIVKSEPQLEALPAGTPTGLRRLIWRCLQKDPLQRLRDIGEARYQLEAPESLEAAVDGAAPPPQEAPASRRWGLAAAGLVLGLGLGIVGGVRLAPGPAEGTAAAAAPTTRFLIEPTKPAALTTVFFDVVIAPDGQSIVYTATEVAGGAFQGTNANLALRRMDRLEPIPLAASPGAVSPFMSPDGRSVGYLDFVESRLERVSVEGGSPTVIADPMRGTAGSFWAADGAIIHADMSGALYEIPAGGGEARVLAQVDAEGGERRFTRPLAAPDGVVVVAGLISPRGENTLVVVDRASGEHRPLLPGDGPIGFTPAGHLIYLRGGDLMVQPMGVGLEPVGTSVTLLEDVSDDVALAGDGTLVYRPGAAGDLRPGRFVWIDRQGNVTPALDEVLIYPRYPRIAPDGRRVVFTAGPGGEGKIWIYDLEGRRPPFNLTFEEHSVFPVWSPDGSRLAYRRSPTIGDGLLYTVAADGSQMESQSVVDSPGVYIPAAWTSADRLIVEISPKTGSSDLVELPSSTVGEPQELVATRFNETYAALSPDERWLAYESDRSGRMEIWAQRYPEGGPARVSSDGGMDPVWSKDGTELYFQSQSALMAARFRPTEAGEPRFDPAVELFRDKFIYKHAFTPRTYDVHPDGRFLMLQSAAAEDDHPGFIVVRNWLGEVERKLADGGE